MVGPRTTRAFGPIVLAAVFAGSAEECTLSDCKCPPPVDSATIELGCASIPPPVVKTTGPCTVCPQALPNGMIPQGSGCAVPDDAASSITLIANGAGACHAEITFANGATSSVDVDFVSQPIAACCGGGAAFVPLTADGSFDNPSVQDPTCDAGQVPEPSD